MGQYLSADFVVGVRLGMFDENYESINPLSEELEQRLEDEYEFIEEGLEYSRHYCMEDAAAFGVRVTWIYDYVSTFDPVELQKRIDEALPKVRRAFEKWGITEELEVLLVLDYS